MEVREVDAATANLGTILLILLLVGGIAMVVREYFKLKAKRTPMPDPRAMAGRFVKNIRAGEGYDFWQQNGTPSPVVTEEADEIAQVNINDLANALNVAIIGPKESGKTTLMRAILTLRPGYVEALDPHNEADKWPCPVIGGGLDFMTIQARMLAAYTTMRERYATTARHERTQASYCVPGWRLTLAGDEWGNVVAELPDVRATRDRAAVLGAGTLLSKLITQGRKVGIGVTIAAHDDTASQLGLGGQMGLVDCFDFICYLGGAATGNTSIPADVRAVARRMPRPAVALDSNRHEWCILILDNISGKYLPRRPDVAAPVDYAGAIQEAAAAGTSLPDNETKFPTELPRVPAVQREVPNESSVPVPTVSPAEIAFISVQLERGMKDSQVAKILPGYSARRYKDFAAKVEYVKGLLANQDLDVTEDDGQRVTQAA